MRFTSMLQKQFIFSLVLFFAWTFIQAAVTPITFTVDLQGANVQPSANGVYLAGNFQDYNYDGTIDNAMYENWNPAGISMNDQGAGIYSVTLDLVPGHYEFKFINGNDWSGVEGVPAMAAMGMSQGGNRYIEVENLPMTYQVCFGGAVACAQNGVLFLVDMSLVDGNGNTIPGELDDLSAEGVHLAGNFSQNGATYPQWDPSALKCTDQGGGIYSILLQLPPGEYQYKFINGNAWGLEEPSSASCFVGGNRVISFGGNLLSLPVVCFGGCGSCIPPTHVTFRVNMSSQTVSPNGVHLAGSFQNWNPGDPEWEMTPIGAGIYELVKDIDVGYYEFKFVNGNDWSGAGNDNESVPLECNVNGNRSIDISGSVQTVQYCYNQCTFSCNNNPGDAPITFQVNMNEYLSGNVLNETLWVVSSGIGQNGTEGAIELTDLDSDGIYTGSVNVTGGSAIYFRYVMGNDPLNPILIENQGIASCGVYDVNNGFYRFHIRSGIAETLDIVCFDRCFNCQGCMDNQSCNFNPNAFIEDTCYVFQMWYADQDLDTFGSEILNVLSCYPVPGYVTQGGDCNDDVFEINPNIPEICDGLDQNCNGELDEFTLNTYYADIDGDGFGDPNNAVFECVIIPGFVLNAEDCDDTQWTYEDNDNDGFGSFMTNACGVLNTSDCNDNIGSINPQGIEICNGLDDNCNVTIDENLSIDWHADADGDGFGSNSFFVNQCAPVPGFVLDGQDCNDQNMNINPMISEVCNLVDDNCNGSVDDGVQFIYYADVDLDGFGSATNFIGACTLPSGYVTNPDDCDDNAILYVDMDGDGYGSLNTSACGVANADDCDDNNMLYSPATPEVCNSLDDNCNGEMDEFVVLSFYADNDGDGFGSANNVAFGCTPPLGYVSNLDDCDDLHITYFDVDMDGFGSGAMTACGDFVPFGDCNPIDANVYPGATELCNSVDDNCDGNTDEGLLNAFYADQDGDGFGALLTMTMACEAPVGYIMNGEDCDDAALTYADVDGDGFGFGGVVACGNSYNADDCDDSVWLFADADSDGHGAGDPVACFGVLLSDDCNDADGLINPDEIEICDGIDQNCNNTVDEGLNYSDYYIDLDGDAFGSGNAVPFCSNPGLGYSTLSTDCDDSNLLINPQATEVLDNNIDENCDGSIEMGVLNLSEQRLLVYPNPAQDYFYIQSIGQGMGELEVWDAQGKRISKGYVFSIGSIRVDASTWNSGLYWIRFSQGGQVQSIKLILE